MSVSVESNVKKVVKALLSQEFVGTKVQRVDVVPDTDWDGDAIFLVTVVVDEPNMLDANKLKGFIGKVREKLQPEAGFPLVSFRSVSDDRGIKSAAA